MRTRAQAIKILPLLFVLISCGGDPVTAPLNFDLAVLTISEGLNYEYGYVPVGEIVEHTFTVTNVGKILASDLRSDFHITAFQYYGGSYPGFGGTCSTELYPEESCSIVIAFSPIHTSVYTAPIQIVYHNGAQEVITARPVLRGTAIGP
ncbi:MAG: hypothetical protein H6617_06125 [Bdellovibrionaceae bacterium]|nr:hypothetical protein [Pseudobdellovibrionaceae bacterium]